MELLITIPLGVLIEVLLFFGLRALFGFGAKPAALLVALLALAVYVPFAILRWPGGDVFAMHLAIYLVSAYALGLIISHREARAAAEGKVEGWFHWGPAAILAFFTVIVLFDAVLVVVASRGVPEPLIAFFFDEAGRRPGVSSRFTGVVEDDYQAKQEHYNRFLEQRRLQTMRGWQIRKGWVGPAVAGMPALFRIEVRDSQGAPVEQARVQGRFFRFSGPEHDTPFVMQEVAPGRYEARITLDLPGRWNLDLVIQRGEDRHEIKAATEVGEKGEQEAVRVFRKMAE